jgi:hypothetical protein
MIRTFARSNLLKINRRRRHIARVAAFKIMMTPLVS